MWSRLLAGAGAVILAASAAFFLLGGASDDPEEPTQAPGKLRSATGLKPVTLPASPVGSERVAALHAEPELPSGRPGLVLTAPYEVDGWDEVTFDATWTSADGDDLSGVVDLQRVDGNSWETVTDVEISAGSGSADAEVTETGVYRLAYGGSGDAEAAASNVVTVVSGDLLPSRMTATAAPEGDDAATVTATWTTEDGVAIIGDIELQEHQDGTWDTVSTMTTSADGTAKAEVEAGLGARFRLVYTGGSRFEATESEAATVVGEDVKSIPVSSCSTNAEIDALPYGAACHFTSVSVATFVVAHDFMGNAWWNAMPMGTIVELEGKHEGLYEVIDRVIAPGRGSALGSASDWTCGGECDVILQTCQGSNTGFTWLRRVSEDGERAESDG